MTPGEPRLRPYDVIALWPEFEGLLMPRQSLLLAMLVDGCTQEEIAASLGITTKTVEAHLRAIRAVLGFPSRRSLTSILLSSLARRTLSGQLVVR